MILINSSPKDALKIFQPFLPIFLPVGIGVVAAELLNQGIIPYIVDEQVDDQVLNKIESFMKKCIPPYIFGFSVLTAAYKSSIVLSKFLKEKYPESYIIFGGIHPTALPEEVLKNNKHIDFVISGEGELILPELYRILKSHGDYTNIKSLSYRSNNDIIHNPRNDIIKDITNMPDFPYNLFADKKKYDLGFVISSRGCPYNCIFCSNRVTTKKSYRYRSAEAVANELEKLLKVYGKRFIIFLDDNFLVNKTRIIQLTEEIKKRGLHKEMTFSFQARGDNADRELLQILFDSGFKSIFFGIESSTNRLLDIVKKGETIEEIINAVKLAKEIGFYVSATFIYSLPTETHDERMGCIQLSNELNLDMVRFNNATPYPGTELFEIAKQEGRLNIQGLYENFNSVSTFIENPFKKIPFSYVPETSTENEIRNDILFSYLGFYLNFSRLKTIFKKPEQGAGWFNAGERLVSILEKIPALVLLFMSLSYKFSELIINILINRNTKIKRSELGLVFSRIFNNANKLKKDIFK